MSRTPNKKLTIVNSRKRLADLLADGRYPSRHGVLRLAEMNDDHLVNALLKALINEQPATITTPLASEVHRRGLDDYALKQAQRRMP